MKQWHQGIFTPFHGDKYRGTTPIIYRSGLELKMMRWCDENENVIQWGSESVVIPYMSPKDGRIHKYFIDFVLKLKTQAGIKNYIVEVKPYKQTELPNTRHRKNKDILLFEQLRFAVDQAKWQSARDWASRHGFNFMIITEKDLK